MGTKVIAFDPGKTTGVAIVLGPALHLIQHFDIKDTDFCEWVTNELHTYEPTHIVYEDYIQETAVTDGEADRYFPQATAKICGALILRAYQLQIPVIRQNRVIKPIGYRYLGMKYPPPKDDFIHQKDAAAHAAYLIKEGIRAGQGQGYRFFDYGVQGQQGIRDNGKGRRSGTGQASARYRRN